MKNENVLDEMEKQVNKVTDLVFMVDGYDEIRFATDEEFNLYKIFKLDQYPKNKIILTSRKEVFDVQKEHEQLKKTTINTISQYL